MTTINKTKPSCTKVNVLVSLADKLPEEVEIKVISSSGKAVKVKKIKIKYDFLSRYCKNCKLQGHSEVQCRVLHLELIESPSENRKE